MICKNLHCPLNLAETTNIIWESLWFAGIALFILLYFIAKSVFSWLYKTPKKQEKMLHLEERTQWGLHNFTSLVGLLSSNNVTLMHCDQGVKKALAIWMFLLWNTVTEISCEIVRDITNKKEGVKEQIANLYELQIPLDRYHYDNTASVLLSGFALWRAHA